MKTFKTFHVLAAIIMAAVASVAQAKTQCSVYASEEGREYFFENHLGTFSLNEEDSLGLIIESHPVKVRETNWSDLSDEEISKLHGRRIFSIFGLKGFTETYVALTGVIVAQGAHKPQLIQQHFTSGRVGANHQLNLGIMEDGILLTCNKAQE